MHKPIIHSSNKANNAVQHPGLRPKIKRQAFNKRLFGIAGKFKTNACIRLQKFTKKYYILLLLILV